MLNSIIATIAALLWLSAYTLFFIGDVARWWALRDHRQAMSEIERLRAVRAYAAWVHNIPPAPPRPDRAPVLVPVPERPPVRGPIVHFPGHRIAEG